MQWVAHHAEAKKEAAKALRSATEARNELVSSRAEARAAESLLRNESGRAMEEIQAARDAIKAESARSAAAVAAAKEAEAAIPDEAARLAKREVDHVKKRAESKMREARASAEAVRGEIEHEVERELAGAQAKIDEAVQWIREKGVEIDPEQVDGVLAPDMLFPLLGQTRHHAWGLTMLMNDDVDFYRERVNPDDPEQVWAVDRWQKLQVHEEVIKIRGQEDRLIRTRSSRHGPIVNDLPGSLEREPVSLFWSFLDPENDSASAFYGFTRATSLDEFQAAAALHSAPGLNLVYADVDDNIAMWAIGKLKRWPQSSNGFSLLNGGSGRDDFLGYQPFETNPRIINPREGVIFSTNNPYAERNPRRKLPGYYAPTDRAQRLEELLNREAPFDLSDFKAFQLDDQRPWRIG